MEVLRDAVRSGQLGFEQAIFDFEKAILTEALERANWNQTRAADKLRITRRSLKLKMDRHNMTPPE